MPTVQFNSAAFPLQENESVLDCLLRHEQKIAHACKSGVCQACLVKAVDNDATTQAQKSLKPTLQAQGYALACQWVPEQDVRVSLPALDECAVTVSISRIEPLNHRIVRLVLEVNADGQMFPCYPGQYLNITNAAGISRSYSIANHYAVDQCIELHVQHMPMGAFTGWLFTQARVGDILHVRGPAGDCFYSNPTQETFPMVLAGTGTGLAPLYGIVHEALREGHQGPIHLFHGGVTSRDLYCVEALRALESRHPQFHYHASCLKAPENLSKEDQQSNTVEVGALDEVILRHLDAGSIAQTRVYLCGAPELVQLLRKKIFLKGAKSSHIYCDPFIERRVSAAA
ncbi:MAG: FAD-binding oxidoreductase [Gammaproteobacteria bacterium]|nr:FAD-binding oxidoreductase [Gammaproteobacteria bacterium]